MVIDNNRCKYDIEKSCYILNLYINASILEIPHRCGTWKGRAVLLIPIDGVFESHNVNKINIHFYLCILCLPLLSITKISLLFIDSTRFS